MKKILAITIALFVLHGCKKENSIVSKVKEVKQQAKNINSAIETTSKAGDAMSNLSDDIERLADLAPLSNDQLKAWLPEKIKGLARSSYKIGEMKMMGMSSVEATFENEEKSKKLNLNFIDGAGGGAMIMSSVLMAVAMDLEEESESEIRRTVEKNGMKGIEEFQKDGSHAKLQLIKDRRYVVELNGNDMDIDELWDIVNSMQFKNLD